MDAGAVITSSSSRESSLRDFAFRKKSCCCRIGRMNVIA